LEALRRQQQIDIKAMEKLMTSLAESQAVVARIRALCDSAGEIHDPDGNAFVSVSALRSALATKEK
jgi:hypothetical protein